MGFFSFVQEIAMDLGTANTIIISDDKIVVDEPSVVALDRRTDKMIAVGGKAKMMYEKTHETYDTTHLDFVHDDLVVISELCDESIGSAAHRLTGFQIISDNGLQYFGFSLI